MVQSSKFWGAFPLKRAVVLVLNPADDRLPVDSHALLQGPQNEQLAGIFLPRDGEAATQLVVQLWSTLVNSG